jgi:predicted RNase H-like HicB family nuclease
MNRINHEHKETITAAGTEYRCLFRRCPDGGYFVTCSELPPMLAFGETLAEARRHAIEEIEGWLEVLAEQGHHAFRNGYMGR